MIENSIKDFIDYCNKNIRGDEKGEAQTFLERFFMALGYPYGHKETSGEFEFRLKGKDSTSFADFVWKKRVLIEMKKAGEDLSIHLQQATSYWMKLAGDRPQYIILCNFDEFWIYDFNADIYKPVEIVQLKDLDKHKLAFSFLLPAPSKPVFGKDREDVTANAAEKVAAVFRTLQERKIPREDALRYCLQCVIAMFAEDAELLPDKIFTRLMEECNEDTGNSYDLIGGLFEEMNRQGTTPAGKYKGVDYFNGGLFEKIVKVKLSSSEINRMQFAAMHNWRNVNPAIFGSLFENGLEKGERHVLGAHYTHEIDIKKIVDPVIVQPWTEKIEAAETLDEYYELLDELSKFKVLDPACGSGNFLFIAFKEMKLLEKKLLSIVRNKSLKKEDAKRLQKFLTDYKFVTTDQFYGIDIKPFAVELAKVTLMVAKELSWLDNNEAYDNKFKPLPLDNLDKNIVCADALLDGDKQRKWPEVDAIIGNPPYQSKNKMQEEFGVEYVNKLRSAYPEVPGRADFCVYWFYKAHQHLKKNSYAGLVGTNTIRQNYSREGSLDYIVKNGGTIFNAVSSEPWSGEAAVHVSIASWKKGKQEGKKNLFTTDKKGNLELHKVANINSSLSLYTDVTSAKVLECNKKPKKCFQGQTHGHDGFLISVKEATKLLKENKNYVDVLKPFLIGDELVGNIGSQPKRFVIDFGKMDMLEASAYKKLFAILKEKVLPEIKEKAELEKAGKIKANGREAWLKMWWKMWRRRENMIDEVSNLKRYIACARVTQRAIFEFFDNDIRPNDKVMVFAFDDDYSFGIIQSNIHWKWFLEKCTTLGDTPNYNTAAIWDTFPFPQNPSQKQIEKVAKAAKALRDARNKAMKEHHYSLRDLYRILEQPGKNLIRDLHAELDEAVLDAYNFDVPPKEESVTAKKKKPKETRETNCDCIADIKDSPLPPFYYENTEEEDGIDEFHESDVIYQTKKRQKLLSLDMLEKLLELNLLIHEREKQGKKVQAPGLPDWVKDKEKFVTDDCVRFEE